MARLCAYAWPGNIRELQNVIERAAVLSAGPVLSIEKAALPGLTHRPAPTRAWSPESAISDATAHRPSAPVAPMAEAGGGSLEEVERQHIVAVLKQTHWQIEGGQGAAKILNLQPSTLRSRMQKLGIARPGA
jgi:transcriptional regulator with GAF, ATPase, and Fis domain